MDNYFPFTFFCCSDLHFADKNEYEYENLIWKENQMLPFFDVQITYKIHSF